MPDSHRRKAIALPLGPQMLSLGMGQMPISLPDLLPLPHLPSQRLIQPCPQPGGQQGARAQLQPVDLGASLASCLIKAAWN